MCRRASQNQSQSTFASVLVGSDVTVDRGREKESTRIVGAVACVLVASPQAKRRLSGIGPDPSFVDEGF